MTPFHVAAKFGFVKILELLLNKMDNNEFFTRNICSSSYASSTTDIQTLHLLCKNKEDNAQLVNKILEKIREISPFDLNEILQKTDINRQTILQICIEENHLKTVEILLSDYYIDDLLEDRAGNLPIHLCAKYGSVEVFEILKKKPEPPLNLFKTNGNYENAMHIAAANNKFKFIKEFLAHEKLLADKKDPAFLKEYLPSVKCINRNGYTPIFVGLIAGNLKCVEALMASENCDLDTKDSKGNSLYHICAEVNNFEALRVFLAKKDMRFVEPLFIRNNQEDSVVHTASKFGNIEIIKLVLSKIFDGFSSLETYLTSKNKDGYTW
jgi:ankyrin repeat protein